LPASYILLTGAQCNSKSNLQCKVLSRAVDRASDVARPGHGSMGRWLFESQGDEAMKK